MTTYAQGEVGARTAPPPPSTTARSRAAGALASIGLPTAAVAVHAALYGRWIVDDAAITFAYARSIAEGDGPVLQDGARPVEGWSNPAWLAVLVIGRALGLFDQGAWFGVPDYVAFPKAVALLCCAALFAAFLATARAVCRRPVLVATAAGLLTATIPSFVIWSFSGLENALLAAAIGWLAALLVRATAAGHLASAGTAAACGALAALAALTRPDGAIYVLAYPLVLLLLLARGRPLMQLVRPAAVSVAAFAVPVGAYVAWRVQTFASLVPNTALAKQGLPEMDAVALLVVKLARYGGWLVVPAALAVLWIALRDRTAPRRALVALTVPFSLAVVAYLVLDPDWMGNLRFATPVWATAPLLFAAAAERAWDAAAGRWRAVLAGSLALSLLVAGAFFGRHALVFRGSPTVPTCAVASYAGWDVNEAAGILGLRNGSVATPDIGATALVSELRVVDLAGLADPEIAGFWADEDIAGLRDRIFAEPPDFVELHASWTTATGLLEDPRFDRTYVELRRSGPLDGLWVRRALVSGDDELAELRALADRRGDDPFALEEPRRSCGDVLRPGTSPG